MTTTNQTKKTFKPLPRWVRAIECFCEFAKVAFWSDIVFELITSIL